MNFFSVIIPVYNREQDILKALNSVINQTFGDYEIVVVDDGSTDGTAAVLNCFKEKIEVIRHRENLGVSAARNSAIKSASGQYIALLDSDDEWYPHKLAEDFRYLEQNNQVKIHQSNEEWVRNGKKVNPKFKHKKLAGNIFEKSLELCLISPSSVVMHNSLFDKYGLFDETMRVCEDYDLWLRL
jgi:glycosyltransferase involved in cell wall biosynthesis